MLCHMDYVIATVLMDSRTEFTRDLHGSHAPGGHASVLDMSSHVLCVCVCVCECVCV